MTELQKHPATFAALGALAVITWNSFNAGRDVQDTYATRKYVDDQDKVVLDKAFEHSDRNRDAMSKSLSDQRAEMMQAQASQGSDLKVQGVKIDQVLKDMSELKDQIRATQGRK